MRNFLEFILLVSQDADQLRKMADLDIAIDDTDATTASTFQGGQRTLAAGATDIAVAFGGVTAASLVVVVAYDDVTLRVNDIAAAPIQLRTTPAVADATVLSTVQRYSQPGLFVVRGRVDSLYLTNPSSTASASVYVALVGEAA